MKEQYEKEIREKLEKVLAKELNTNKCILNKDEKIIRQDYIINLYKILKNYDELEPVLKAFFERKHRIEKRKALEESWDSISK